MVTVGLLDHDDAGVVCVHGVQLHQLPQSNISAMTAFLGPSQNYDPWPRMLLLYIFQQYNEINAYGRARRAGHVQVSHVPVESVQRPQLRPAVCQHMDSMYVSKICKPSMSHWLYDNYGGEKQQFRLIGFE